MAKAKFESLSLQEAGRLCLIVLSSAVIGLAGFYSEAETSEPISGFAHQQIHHYNGVLNGLNQRATTDQDRVAHRKLKAAISRFDTQLAQAREAASDVKKTQHDRKFAHETLRSQIFELQEVAAQAIAAAHQLDTEAATNRQTNN